MDRHSIKFFSSLLRLQPACVLLHARSTSACHIAVKTICYITLRYVTLCYVVLQVSCFFEFLQFQYSLLYMRVLCWCRVSTTVWRTVAENTFPFLHFVLLSYESSDWFSCVRGTIILAPVIWCTIYPFQIVIQCIIRLQFVSDTIIIIIIIIIVVVVVIIIIIIIISFEWAKFMINAKI
jgi:hypothetical protein